MAWITKALRSPFELWRKVLLVLLRRGGGQQEAADLARLAGQELAAGRPTSARRFAEAAIHADPTWRDAYGLLGQAALGLGNVPDARRAYVEGLRMVPNDPYLWGALADLEWQEGHYPAAELAYEHALQGQPRHAEPAKLLLNYALSILEQGRVREAASVLEQAWPTKPMHPSLGLALAEVYSKQGRDEEAVKLLRELLIHEPSLARAHADLGYALYKLGEQEEAIAETRRAVSLEPASVRFRALATEVTGAPKVRKDRLGDPSRQ